MNREQVLYVLFFVLTAITALHFTGLDRFWYWTYWWFDLVTHFAFGFWVGLFALWLILLSGYFGVFSARPVLIFTSALVAVGVVGVAWEVFEVWAGIPVREGHALDTALDLVMDLFGALLGYLFFTSSWVRKN